MSSTQVALAGATGNLGGPILEALLTAGFRVTVLSRIGGNSSKLGPHPSLTIKEVDFNSVQSLTAALDGTQVVVSCLATLAIGGQSALIDAAVAADVKRFIPAEFGMDSRNPLGAKLPVCAPKVATQEYLQAKSNANPTFTWTGVANGMFLDWCLQAGIIVDLRKHTAVLYNGGDVRFSATLLADVARAILGIITHQDETANRLIYIQSALINQNQLIQYATDKDRKAWNTVKKSTEEVRQEGFAELAKGTPEAIDAGMLAFCICGMWDPDYGCDFSSHLDNELLGIKALSEGDLRALVESFL